MFQFGFVELSEIRETSIEIVLLVKIVQWIESLVNQSCIQEHVACNVTLHIVNTCYKEKPNAKNKVKLMFIFCILFYT